MGSATNQKGFKPTQIIPKSDSLTKQISDSHTNNKNNNDINNNINNNDSASKASDNDRKIKPHFPDKKPKPTGKEKESTPEVEAKIDLPTSSKTFNVALAGLMISENDTLKDTDIEAYVKKAPSNNGIWIPENQRSQIIKLINTYSSQSYDINSDGYLYATSDTTQDISKSKTFSEKINQLISGNEVVILSLSDSFWSYDNQTLRLSKKAINDTTSVSIKFNQSRLVILNKNSFNITDNVSSDQAILLINQIFKDGTDYSSQIINEIKTNLDNSSTDSEKLSDNTASNSSSTVNNSSISTNDNSSSISNSTSDFIKAASTQTVSSDSASSNKSVSNQNSSSGTTKDNSSASSSCESKNMTSAAPSTASDASKLPSSNSSSPMVSEPTQTSDTQSSLADSEAKDTQQTSSSTTSSEKTDDVSNKNKQPLYSAFDVALAGLSCKSGDTLSSDNIQNDLKSIPTKNGVWIPTAYRDDILSLINEGSSETFTVDADGYLKLDDNSTTDSAKSSIITEKLLLLIQGNQRIILASTDKIWYYDGNSDSFFNSAFGDTYSIQFQSQDSRLILLNSTLFKKYSLENNNIIVSALLFDQLFNDGIDYSTIIKLPRSFAMLSLNRIATSGTMKSAQTAYMGPGTTSIYAKAGSVDSGESVSVINIEQGWIYIEYNTSNGHKRGYVPSGTVSYSGSLPTANYLDGYYNATTGERNIYYLPSTSGLTVGSVYSGEGVTVLSTDGDVSYVEYSSSSGTKRGYVDNSNLASRHDGILGIVTASSTSVYSGTDTNFYCVGSIGKTEYAVLLKDNGIWAFVEYNTPSGRKRGYTQLLNITNHNSTSSIPNIYVSRNLGVADAELTAYYGPNSNYAKLGTVFNGDQVNIVDINEYGWCYVEYYTGNHASKRGYVDLDHINRISLTSIPTPSAGTSISYGTSTDGRSLKAYKLGSGPNTLFAVFAQHGFEDGWAADGIELVKIANNLLSGMKANGNLSKWTIYVIPTANPDALLGGYTNNGYGRCTYYGYDMNRSHNTNPSASFTDSRNKTNSKCSEVVALENFITSNKSSSGQNVLLDVHGWENSTLGDPTISKYFGDALGLRHVSDGGSNGYLIKWGAQNNIASVLVELPLTSNAAALANLNIYSKFNSAVSNLLANSGYNNADTSQVVGCIDTVNGDYVSGWARDNNNKADSINVDTYIKDSSGNNVFSKRVVANRYRSDVAPGSHGYRFDMDWMTYKPGTYKIYSYGIGKNGNNPLLTNSPLTYTVSAPTGCVDYVDESGIGGWAWKSSAPNKPVRVEVCINDSNGDTVWSTTVNADQYRSDLKNLDYGNGYHGFSIAVPWGNIETQKLNIIVYAVDGSGQNNVIYRKDYENPCVYRKNSDTAYSTTLSSTPRCSIVSDAIDNAKASFNKMTLAEHAVQEENISRIIAAAAAIDFFGENPVYTKYKDAGDSLNHYLNGNGQDYQRNFMKMNKEWKYAADNLTTEVNNVLDAAEYFNRTTHFTRTSYAQLGKAQDNRDDPSNWYYAIGNFNVTSTCSVTKIAPDSFSVTINYSFEDYYDWNQNNKDMGKLPVSPQELYLLHYSGYAQEYLNKGTSVIEVTWKSGQRYDSGANVKVIS